MANITNGLNSFESEQVKDTKNKSIFPEFAASTIHLNEAQYPIITAHFDTTLFHEKQGLTSMSNQLSLFQL